MNRNLPQKFFFNINTNYQVKCYVLINVTVGTSTDLII